MEGGRQSLRRAEKKGCELNGWRERYSGGIEKRGRHGNVCREFGGLVGKIIECVEQALDSYEPVGRDE